MPRMTRLFSLILTALLCACSAEIADEPVGETTEALSACDPFVTEPFIPQPNWVGFEVVNFGTVACVTADAVKWSLTRCAVYTNGQKLCGNVVPKQGPITLAKVAQPGWILNVYVGPGVPCQAGSGGTFVGDEITSWVEWKSGSTTKTRTATHKCY
jgi:hypothetical protein